MSITLISISNKSNLQFIDSDFCRDRCKSLQITFKTVKYRLFQPSRPFNIRIIIYFEYKIKNTCRVIQHMLVNKCD